MPRFERINRGMKSLPIELSVQLLPGTFEHALLVDEELDLRPLDAHFKNDAAGAPACAPGAMIRIILHAQSREPNAAR